MLLQVADIHTYYGKSHVLHGVSMEIEEGEIVALLGRNGVGKSTTLKSIIGMTPPQAGSIRLKGKRSRASSPTLSVIRASVTCRKNGASSLS